MKNTGAIVCEDIAHRSHPILYAERSDPLDEADSGWQFTCGSGADDPACAEIWSLEEVLKIEPSLRKYMDMPSGTSIERNSTANPWIASI